MNNSTYDIKASDIFDVRTRFLRSVQLERDFDDPNVISGYVPTEFSQQCLERMIAGLAPKSGQRAWRMTGDYGSGKSSFALLLAHTFSGHEFKNAPHISKSIRSFQKPYLIPILVTCSRQPLTISILESLIKSLNRIYTRGPKPKIYSEIYKLLNSDKEPTDDAVVNLIVQVNSRIIEESKVKGILLILDELGKFLEYAALNPHRQDVFLLQRLAEIASRSGEETLFLVSLLHQGFNAYAESLSQSSQREWEKVAGRFEEIVFNQPVDEIAHLIASALNVNTNLIPKSFSSLMKQSMRQTYDFGWFGAASIGRLAESSSQLFPLHPTVLPVLIRIFRRFGQNERSLFSFLLSNEPFGLQAFSTSNIKDIEPYRLHNLYDYVRTNFGHRLSVLSYRSHWNLIDSVIESFATEEDVHIRILKTVGILNLLNDSDLTATEDSVLCALADNVISEEKKVKSAISILRREKKVLYDRGRTRGFCLWPHTSVDLEKALDDAKRSVDTPQRVAELIKDYLQTRPIVARRHYIETGNLRYYEVLYCSVDQMRSLLSESQTDADGLIIIPLCETVLERNTAIEFAKQPDLSGHENWLIAVPKPLYSLANLVLEYQRWDWVSKNTLELNADKFAREEVSRQKEAARAQLEKRIQNLFGLKQFGTQMSLEWFHLSTRIDIRDGRYLLQKLSAIFDDIYPESPQINNELVNRMNLSSAAAAARMRLIERMLTHHSEEFLGMNPDKKPPEMSMYLSVLKNTGLHREGDDGWKINEPHHRSANCNVLPALRRIKQIVQKKPDTRINVAHIFDELRKPPFGVRDGLLPILLTVFSIAHEQNVAFYRDGTFLREITGETMLVLTKAPDKFEVQYCKIEGVRADLFEKLLSLLEVTSSSSRKTEILDVVKPLCVFVAQLPPYVQNTKKLSPNTLAVREKVLNAREPVRLLFNDLPMACGFNEFSTYEAKSNSVLPFVKALKSSLDELRVAYPELNERLKKHLREAFPSPLGSFQEFRTSLANRSEIVVLGVQEPTLKSFCLRLMDDNLQETEWLESIGSHLTHKPPERWFDAEEESFIQELSKIANRFINVESIVFKKGKSSRNGTGVRLSITKADGNEHEQVVYFNSDEEKSISALQKRFEEIIVNDQRLGLAAASRALWNTLKKEKE